MSASFASSPTRSGFRLKNPYIRDGFYTRQDCFKDPESGKTLVFITNNFSLPAATICALYKSRWQVELFFKSVTAVILLSLTLYKSFVSAKGLTSHPLALAMMGLMRTTSSHSPTVQLGAQHEVLHRR